MNETTTPTEAQAFTFVPSARPRHWLRWLIILLLGVLIATGAWWLLSRPPETIRFTTAEVERGDLAIRVTATGTLQPVNQVDVGTEVSGTIVRVLVDFNDRVEAGQVLAELDPDQSRAKTRQSEAALALAEARVEEAEATVAETASKLQRTRDLIGKRMASPEELDTATAAARRASAALGIAQAQVRQAQAELDANRWNLEKTIIRSPIHGMVLRRQVEPGQTVAASLQTPVLFTLAESLAHMELNVAIDEADVGQIEVGQSATFAVDAYPERSFPATITQVRFAPETINGVVTYAALLALDNSDLALRPGMTATAEILAREVKETLLVPNAALRFTPPRDESTPTSGPNLLSMLLPRSPSAARRARESDERAVPAVRVWILEEGKPKAIPVKTGASDGIRTQLLETELAPGDRVLIGVERQRGAS